MRKTFRLEDLDCAHCAGKMEKGIRKLQGVREANIAFFAQKITIDAEDERFDEIMKEVQKVIKGVEPNCKIIL